jgi:hypothetical protein
VKVKRSRIPKGSETQILWEFFAMRAFFVICLGCLCTAAFGNLAGAAPAADAAKADCGKPAANPLPTVTVKQVQTVLSCIEEGLKANADFKCKLMQVQSKMPDVFNKEFWPSGTSIDVKTEQDWDKAGKPIFGALKDTPPTTDPFKPDFALRAEVRVGTKCACLPGKYVLLMSCKGKAAQLYFEKHLVGWCWIDDITGPLNEALGQPATASK